MNKKDLDALKELYSSVYDEEQLNERAPFGLNPLDFLAANSPDAVRQRERLGQEGKAQRERERVTRATNQRAQLGVVKTNKGYVANDSTAYDGDKSAQAVGLADRLNKEGGLGKYEKNKAQPAAVRPTKPIPATTPTAARPAAGSGSTPPQRPAARPSGPVLSKKDGVEGTGVGADFKARAFSAAEKSRYSSVAAQNAAKSSTASGTPKPSSPTPAASAPKPPTPAVGMLGKTSFERRTPTSAELRAAQTARAGGASPEKALQAAQKTNLPTQGPTPAIPSASSVAADVAKANSPAVINKPAPAGTALAKQQAQQKSKPPTPGTMTQSYEWPSAKTIRDIAGAYSSIYEAKKKVDQDQDGDNDFADVRVARMIASGVPKAKAIAMVKDKSYNEEVELWVNELIEEGYDLSEYTWDEMAEIYLDEATRMRKELGREGEIATRKELERRSNAYQRSGSVDRTIAAAERRADRPYVKNVRGESESDYNQRLQRSSDTMSKLAASRRGSVRDKPRAGLRGYAAKGSDNELHDARRSAMAAGTLTPREKKMLNREAYETYEFVASYLLENNFTDTIEGVNVIINNMSEGWFESIVEEILDEKTATPPSRWNARKGLDAETRRRRRSSDFYIYGGENQDPDERKISTSKGEGGVTKNPKKLRKQKAMGEH